MSRLFFLGFIAVAFVSSGCLTFAGGELEDLEPLEPKVHVTVESSVGEFYFYRDRVTVPDSEKRGDIVNEAILDKWKKKNYVSNHAPVQEGAFTGKADYSLTLNGSQIGESNVLLRQFSIFTLFLVPYSVDTWLRLEFELQDLKTGDFYRARVKDHYRTQVELLLLPMAPLSMRGQSKTYDRIAEHLYQQFYDQGAFGADLFSGH